MDARCLITPHMIACEFQMVLAREMKVCPLRGEMKYAVLPSVNDEGLLYIKVESLGWGSEISVTMRDLMMSMDEFSERRVKPSVEHIKHLMRGIDGQVR